MDRYEGKRGGDGGRPSREKKPKKPKKPSRLTRQQKVLVAVAAVLAVALTAVLVYRSLFVKPTLPQPKDPADTDAQTIDWGEGVQPRAGGARKSQDWYTVLILGRDTGGGGNTDTMLLASYDVTNQKATVMSIPRDTMVNVPWDIKRINSVYNYYGGGDKGIQNLYKEISQLVGFEPDYQVVVEWEAVGEIVDAMGGVWFDVPRDMHYKDPYQDLVIEQTAGYRLLSGDDAMQVLRYRHDNRRNGKTLGYPDGDLGRIKTQQAFLTAMVSQLLKLENITKVNQFVKVFQENVKTDLSFQNILWFAKAAYLGGLNMSNVNFVTMPNRNVSLWSRTVGNMQSYVVPSANELLDLVNQSLSPFAERFTLSDLDILSVNSDGSIRSSTGHVEDARAAVPPVKPSAPPAEPKDDPEETAEPSAGTTIDPSTGWVVDPGTGFLIDPDTGELVEPNAGGTTDPNGGTTTDPNAGGTTDPNGGTATDPNAGGTTDPNGGTTTDPNAGGTPDPNAGTTTDPNAGGTTDPNAGTVTEPGTNGEIIAPAEPPAPESPDAGGAAPAPAV